MTRDALARVLRALEALEDGEVGLALQILHDLIEEARDG